MRTRLFLLVVTIASGVAFLSRTGSAQTGNRAPSPAALTGQVTSAEEGPMEGVLVTAKKTDSTIAITVVSDAQGRYRFPSAKLEPGHYAIRIRAVGYDLDGLAAPGAGSSLSSPVPGAGSTLSPPVIDVSSQKAATADLKLRKTSDLSKQLTNAEWMESMPGTLEQRSSLRSCVTCHTLDGPVRSIHDADEFVQVQERMASYVNQSIPEAVQKRVADRLSVQQERGEEGGQPKLLKARQQMAEFLSSINLSKTTTWSYPLKTFPRPTGRATRVIITEYDLPKPIRQPHDVIVDSDGMAWYTSFGEQIFGKLDPKTGKTTEFAVPLLKPGSPTGELSVRADEDGNMWLGMMFQGGVAKFDRKTEKFQTWNIPPEYNKGYTQTNQTDPMHSKVDGKVWVQESGTFTLFRLEPATGKFEYFEPFPQPSPNIYDIIADSQNNVYFTVFGEDQIGRIDAKTGKITFYKTPTPNSAPRRGSIDSRDRLWFGEYRGNRIGMFDTETQRFQEWTPPTPWALPYDVVADKNGEVWTGSMLNDRVTRLDPKSGQMTDYLLPRSTNIRRVFVDNSTTPVTFWVGNNHGASIIKLEPLD
jgi:virginiamycin B lyase